MSRKQKRYAALRIIYVWKPWWIKNSPVHVNAYHLCSNSSSITKQWNKTTISLQTFKIRWFYAALHKNDNTVFFPCDRDKKFFSQAIISNENPHLLGNDSHQRSIRWYRSPCTECLNGQVCLENMRMSPLFHRRCLRNLAGGRTRKTCSDGRMSCLDDEHWATASMRRSI